MGAIDSKYHMTELVTVMDKNGFSHMYGTTVLRAVFSKGTSGIVNDSRYSVQNINNIV